MGDGVSHGAGEPLRRGGEGVRRVVVLEHRQGNEGDGEGKPWQIMVLENR